VALVEPRAGLPSELEARLRVQPGITIVSRTSSVGQALGKAVKRPPDVVIIDANSLWGAVRSAEITLTREGVEGPVTELTRRERQVIALVAEGRTSREIAFLLQVTPRTVEAHRENIGRKLGIRTVAAFTRFAIAHGMLEAD
jgi:DNA-binding NarL/FixJ family response regulator